MLEDGLYTQGERNQNVKLNKLPWVITTDWGKHIIWATREDDAEELCSEDFPDETIFSVEEGE